MVIGGEGRRQKSNLVSCGCSRAATKKGKTRNVIILEPEVITMRTSDVLPEPVVIKITIVTPS